ncbi:MAG: hypothetical protein KC433_16380 [Anaerolineales bacterium]|nr:hypothetical protein [Anaerolineales bacterium]MCB8940037.1 hypothetical protein [Ardenticatenaceae bacterium]
MKRLEWVLGIMMVVLLIIVAALSLTFWFGNRNTAVSNQPFNSATIIAERADDIAPTSVFDGRTAMVAYAAAQQTATEWQSDAVLLNAQATWPQGASVTELRQGETTWGFTFYSPQAQEIAILSVVEDTAVLVSSGPHQQANPVLSATGWNVDSKEAIEALLANGGNNFLATSGVATLTMALFADDQESNGRMEWQLSLFSLQSNQALTIRLDATSGELLASTLP